MIDTKLILFPRQKAMVAEGTFINLFSAIEMIRKNNLPQILNARQMGKGDEYYEHIKEKSPHFMFGSIPGKNKKIANIERYTGLIFCDIDQDSINECAYTLAELKSAIFDHYPFVVFCSLSFGGKGLGFVISCPKLISYNSPSAYEQAYKQFAAKIHSDFNLALSLDAVCFNPNRQTTLSFDPEILLREHPLPFEFDYDDTIPYNGGNVTEHEVDLSLRKNEKLFAMFQERFRDYYTSVSWAEISTGKPVLYQEDLKFDSKKYYLTRYFDKNVMDIYDTQLKNDSSTLVYISEGIAATTLMTSSKFKIKHGSRANFMKAFILNYLYLLKNAGKADKVGKIYIYNLMLALNTRMYDKKGIKHTPLYGNEINILTQVVMEIFTAGEFNPTISKKLHIRTQDCLSIVSLLYKPGAKPRSVIVNEIKKIKDRIQEIKFDTVIYNYVGLHPNSSLIRMMAYTIHAISPPNGKSYKWETLKRKINKKVSFKHSHTSIMKGGGIKEEGEYTIDTFNLILKCVEELMNGGHKVKQVDVIRALSGQMAPITVKRYWLEIKEKLGLL